MTFKDIHSHLIINWLQVMAFSDCEYWKPCKISIYSRLSEIHVVSSERKMEGNKDIWFYCPIPGRMCWIVELNMNTRRSWMGATTINMHQSGRPVYCRKVFKKCHPVLVLLLMIMLTNSTQRYISSETECRSDVNGMPFMEPRVYCRVQKNPI